MEIIDKKKVDALKTIKNSKLLIELIKRYIDEYPEDKGKVAKELLDELELATTEFENFGNLSEIDKIIGKDGKDAEVEYDALEKFITDKFSDIEKRLPVQDKDFPSVETVFGFIKRNIKEEADKINEHVEKTKPREVTKEDISKVIMEHKKDLKGEDGSPDSGEEIIRKIKEKAVKNNKFGFSILKGGANVIKKIKENSNDIYDIKKEIKDQVVQFNQIVDGNGSDVIAGDVNMGVIGTPTYDDVQDWSDTTQSAGIIEGGVISNAGSGTIDIEAIKGIIKTTNSETGENLFFDLVASTGLAVDDGVTSYISVDYNSGTPQIDISTTNTANGHDMFNVGKVYREGTDIDIISSGLRIEDFSKRVQQHHLEKNNLHFVSGAIVGDLGNLFLSITAGVMYAGLNRILTDAVDTGVSGDFEYYYYNGTDWVETDETEIDNLNYNDITSGLTPLTSQRYGVHWVYKGTNGNVYVIAGQGDYTLTQAQNAQPPASLPNHVSEFGVFRAKIIVQKSSATFTEIESVEDISFQPITPTNHNELSNLQGGTANEYYHLTNTEHTDITTKAGLITVTQPVDLDDIEDRVNNLDAAVVLKGDWDASSGTFPENGLAQAGYSYIVSVAGTVDSIDFNVNDRVIAILDNASETVYAGNWIKADYTDQVLSVAGKTGVVVLEASDISDFDTKVSNNTDVANNTAKVGVTTEISNVSEDNTPQLGGELDAQGHSIGFTMQTATGDGNTAVDWKLGNHFDFTFGATNEVFTFTAPSKSGVYTMSLKQDSTGSRTVTWPATVKWAGGVAPTLTTTAGTGYDIISFRFDGTNYYATTSLNFS